MASCPPMGSCSAQRADLYHALAEAMAEPLEWLTLPGREWPLFKMALYISPRSAAARNAVERLADVGAESLAARQLRYAALFGGPGRPRYWLYESMARHERLFGPVTFTVDQWYRTAGLCVSDAELPDHASLELAFLSFLAERQAVEESQADEWRILEQGFIEKHAGCWLPELGRALARNGDAVYAPIGELMAEWLDEAVGKDGWMMVEGGSKIIHQRQPVIPRSDSCTLCGFCVQVCPTHALVVRETREETMLVLSGAACVGCGKCMQVCEMGALKMTNHDESYPIDPGAPAGSDCWVLRYSPRVICSACGMPTVSRAELDYVAERLGHPVWLEYCQYCRTNGENK